MADKTSGDKLLYCSFCGKSQHEVRKLIAGPSVFICDECIELCNDIIREEGATSDTARADKNKLPTPHEIRQIPFPSELQAMFYEAHGFPRFRQRRGSRKGMKNLERFQRVFLDTRANGLFENGMKIDKEASAQHAVDLVFADGVLAHQEFELGGLVSSEMIDVHRRVGLPASSDFID